MDWFSKALELAKKIVGEAKFGVLAGEVLQIAIALAAERITGQDALYALGVALAVYFGLRGADAARKIYAAK